MDLQIKIKMQEKQTDIGVVIGRFQLHELHEAHIELIENNTKLLYNILEI